MTKALDVFHKLDRLSRTRALTDAESELLERAIFELDNPPARNPRAWTDEMRNRLCDIIADGGTYSDAAKALGKSNNSCIGAFGRIARGYGWQAA